MDGYENAALGLIISEKPIPIPRAPRAPKWSGWLIGAACGVLASLWAFPSVRYTLTAQLQFALAEDSVPWISSLDAQRSAREVPLLNRVAASNPDDYLLQVGRATALASIGGARLEEAPLGCLHLRRGARAVAPLLRRLRRPWRDSADRTPLAGRLPAPPRDPAHGGDGAVAGGSFGAPGTGRGSREDPAQPCP